MQQASTTTAFDATTGPARTNTRPLPGRDRALYLAQHFAFGAFCGPFMRMLHRVLNPKAGTPTKDELKCLEVRYRRLLERDLENAARGIYPRALLFESALRDGLRSVPGALPELLRVLVRGRSGRFTDLPQIEHREGYPRYYLRNFHWQSDGWFSRRSAEIYDLTVELLFMGAADVMRRMALPPVVAACRDLDRPRILDIACGTGGFLRHLHRAVLRARLYGLDLSPDYLKHAQRVLEDVPDVSLVHENAENMSFKADSFDVVTSVFLFHELPRDARRTVMAEVLRVLAPEGRFVICDSAQTSDSPELERVLETFPALYHEPYYKGYLKDALEDALDEVGFEVESIEPHYLSKVVVARRRRPTRQAGTSAAG